MRIENLLLNNFILNNKEEIFNEGHTFKGEVLELIEDLILIDVKGHGIIQAKLEVNMKMTVGDEVSFLVESVDNNEIILRPLIKDKLLGVQLSKDGKENNPISNLLKNINIKETKLSIGLVENLMKYNVPLTEQNLTDGIKTLEKLIQLSNLKDGEKVILFNPVTIDEDLTLDKIETTKETFTTTVDSVIKEGLLVQGDSLENVIEPERRDIKYLLVTNKEDNNEFKDLRLVVEEYLGNKNNIDSEDEYIKTISFFLKNNIKPSLNNIRNLREFNNDPIEFIKGFKEIERIVNKLKYNETEKNIVTDFESNLMKNLISNKSERLDELQKLIRNFSDTANLKLKEEITSLENKIDFLRDLNKELSFLFFPINYEKKQLSGILTLIKENKKKNSFNNKINIFINIDTHNMGNIKVSCQLVGNTLFVKMNIKKEDIELFKSTEKQLIEKILSIGYSLNRIEFIVDNQIEILDTMVSNPNPTYILDLKV